MTNYIVVADDAHAVPSVPMARVSAYPAAAVATAAVRPATAAAFHRRAHSTSVIVGRYRGKSR